MFNNRELVFLFFLVLLLTLPLLHKEMKGLLLRLYEAAYKLKYYFLILALYISSIALILNHFDLWTVNQNKNIITWFITTGFIICFESIKQSIKEIILSPKNILTTIIVVTFVANLKSFSVLTEFIIFVTMSLCILIKHCAETMNAEGISKVERHKYDIVIKAMSIFISLLFISMLMNSIIDIMMNYSFYQKKDIVLDFTTPVFLSLSMIPFNLIVKLYMEVEKYKIKNTHLGITGLLSLIFIFLNIILPKRYSDYAYGKLYSKIKSIRYIDAAHYIKNITTALTVNHMPRPFIRNGFKIKDTKLYMSELGLNIDLYKNNTEDLWSGYAIKHLSDFDCHNISYEAQGSSKVVHFLAIRYTHSKNYDIGIFEKHCKHLLEKININFEETGFNIKDNGFRSERKVVNNKAIELKEVDFGEVYEKVMLVSLVTTA